MLLGYDAIRALGGVHITQTGAVQFQKKAPVCAALRIERLRQEELERQRQEELEAEKGGA